MGIGNCEFCLEKRCDGGPEGVIDEVEKLAPAGFSDINDVMTYHEREARVKGYAATAGFKDVRIDRAP